MKVIKDSKGKALNIHFDDDKGVYVGATHGVAEFGHYGSTYLSLDRKVAIDLAKQILTKYRVKK